MTPQIKFRGFRTDGKGWVEGGYTLDAIGNPRVITVDSSGKGLVFNEIHPSSLGMFTGLTDKNGKEIYGAIGAKGGDVLRIDKSHTEWGGIINKYPVSYVSQSARFHLMGTTYDNLHEALHDISGKNCSEIIGNQFESDNGK